MSHPNYSRTTIVVPPSFSRRNYNTTNRSKPKHHLLRPSRRRRPNPVSTPILILRAPRSVHSNSTGLWHNLPHCGLLCRQKRTIRVYRNSMSYNGHRPPRLYCLSPSHVYSRNGRRHPSIFYIRNNNYCNSHRGQSI